MRNESPPPRPECRATGSFTMVSNAFFDRYLAACSGSEVKVFLYLCRRINGTVKGRSLQSDEVAISQFCRGIRRPDGSALDSGTGLAADTVIAALRGLEEKKLITREFGSGPNPNRYKISTPCALETLPDPSENPRDQNPGIPNASAPKSRAVTVRNFRSTKESSKQSRNKVDRATRCGQCNEYHDGDDRCRCQCGAVHDPSNSQPIDQLQAARDLLQGYVKQCGLDWAVPDESICIGVLEVTGGVAALHLRLRALFEARLAPSRSYAWFLTALSNGPRSR